MSEYQLNYYENSPEMKLIKGEVKVEWIYLGEGYQGNYDPEDPKDEKLLRFDVYKYTKGDWQMVNNGSFCTLMPYNASHEVRRKALEEIMFEIYDDVIAGNYIDRTCQELSHISPSTVWGDN